MGNNIGRIVTPATEEQLGAALTTALLESLQALPSESLGLYLLALIAVENAHGTALIGNNVGNLMAAGYSGGVEKFNWSGDYWRPDWWFTVDSDLHRRMFAGTAPSAFRAYPTLTDGMRAFVGLLMSPSKKAIIAAAKQDNPSAFVAAIHDTYSPDWDYRHVSTVSKLVADYRQRGYFAGFDEPVQKPLVASASSGAGIMLGSAVVAALVALIWRARRGH
jgi:hypothetical protein